jgi:hypothetical protein
MRTHWHRWLVGIDTSGPFVHSGNGGQAAGPIRANHSCLLYTRLGWVLWVLICELLVHSRIGGQGKAGHEVVCTEVATGAHHCSQPIL